MDLNEKWNTKANEITEGDHLVYLIKANNFLDKRNAAYLIYLDWSKVNDTVLPCKLAEVKKGLVHELNGKEGERQ